MMSDENENPSWTQGTSILPAQLFDYKGLSLNHECEKQECSVKRTTLSSKLKFSTFTYVKSAQQQFPLQR